MRTSVRARPRGARISTFPTRLPRMLLSGGVLLAIPAVAVRRRTRVDRWVVLLSISSMPEVVFVGLLLSLIVGRPVMPTAWLCVRLAINLVSLGTVLAALLAYRGEVSTDPMHDPELSMLEADAAHAGCTTLRDGTREVVRRAALGTAYAGLVEQRARLTGTSTRATVPVPLVRPGFGGRAR